MRKAFLGLLMFSFLVLSLAIVSAETCSPSGGYTFCYQWDNVETYGSCRAHSFVQIQGTNIQGNYKGGYYVGPTFINYKFDADRGYVYLNQNSWDSLWNTANCDANDGKSCQNADQELSSQGKYYLTQNPGDSFSGCPAFLGTDYDREEQEDCWSWAYTYGAWGWIGNNCLNVKQVECYEDSDCGSNQFCNKAGEWQSWSCQTQICDEGEERCFGSNLQRCEGNAWIDRGTLLNKCGVECLTDSNCPADETSETFCSGNNIMQTNTDNRCFSYQCVSSTQDIIVESCPFKCEEVEGQGAICIDKICDEGDKMCGPEGDTLICYGNLWFLNEECKYGCEDGKCNPFYTTSLFYGIIIGVAILFISLLVVLIVVMSRRRK